MSEMTNGGKWMVLTSHKRIRQMDVKELSNNLITEFHSLVHVSVSQMCSKFQVRVPESSRVHAMKIQVGIGCNRISSDFT